MEINNIFVAKTMRIMTYLSSKGFKLLRTQPDRNNPKFDVFLFKDSEELRKAMLEYKR